MTKTIILEEGRELVLNNQIKWLQIYQDEFGTDILPVLMPALLSGTKMIAALAEEAGTVKGVNEEALIKVANSDTLDDIALRLATGQFTDIMKITWAMAKRANPEIKEYNLWIGEIEEFPLLDTILPAVAELLARGMLTTKNWTRLTENLKSLQPQNKTKKKTTKK